MFRVRLAVHVIEIIFMCSFLVLLETQDNTRNYCQSKMDTCILHIYLFTCMPHAQFSLYKIIIKMQKFFLCCFNDSGLYGMGYIFLVPISVLSVTLRSLTELGKVETISFTF